MNELSEDKRAELEMILHGLFNRIYKETGVRVAHVLPNWIDVTTIGGPKEHIISSLEIGTNRR